MDDCQRLMQRALKITNDFFADTENRVFDRETGKFFMVSNYQFSRYPNKVVTTSPFFNQTFVALLKHMLGDRK